MKKLCRNDEVVVIAGKDKGRRGKILKILNSRVVVEGVNILKKHRKANHMQGTPGSIEEKEGAIHISNVSLWNPETQKADRVGFSFDSNGKKVRVYKSNNQVVGG